MVVFREGGNELAVQARVGLALWHPWWVLWLALISWPALAWGQVFPRREEVVIRADRPVLLRQRADELLGRARRVLRSASGESDPYGAAQELIEEALVLDPTGVQTLFDGGVLSLQAYGDSSVGLGWLEVYLSLATPAHSDWGAAHALLGRAALNRSRDLGHFGAAASLAQAEGHLLWAQAFYHEEGARAASQLAEVEELLCVLYAMQGETAHALRHCHAALAWSGGFGASGLVLYTAGLLVQAREPGLALDLLTRLGGVSWDVLPLMARAYGQLGEWDQAFLYLDLDEAELQQALGLRSRQSVAESYAIKGELHLDRGEYPEAIASWRASLVWQPNAPVYQNNLAWALVLGAEHGSASLGEALLVARSAVLASPSSANLDTLAEVYFRMGRLTEALAALEEALEVDASSWYLQSQQEKMLTQREGLLVSPGAITRVEAWRPQAVH